MSSQLAHIGISVPGLSLAANSHSEWEKTATIEDMAAIVRAADRLGYSHVSCAEHIGVPADQAPRRGARYFDPLATFGYFSAVTSQIRFVTAVLVLGYHHPLEIAKRYGTLDVVSGGRVVLGLGVGTLKEEFDLLGLGGAEFVERGARADDALRALRAALGQSEPEYHGPHYDFGGLIVDPCAIQKDMPLWIGGRSVRSLRRSVTLGDGWMPFGLTVDEMATMIANARAFPSWHEREKPLDLVLPAEFMVDPIGQPEQTAEYLRRLFAAGATKVGVHFRSTSCAHYIEQLEAQALLAVR